MFSLYKLHLFLHNFTEILNFYISIFIMEYIADWRLRYSTCTFYVNMWMVNVKKLLLQWIRHITNTNVLKWYFQWKLCHFCLTMLCPANNWYNNAETPQTRSICNVYDKKCNYMHFKFISSLLIHHMTKNMKRQDLTINMEM